ncbi:MAG: PAS domain S-box protein [Sedimentisphaerales bacterium]|nr:PAS domain S-box protein [Sedimentisphaerales bacterium]
MRADSQLVSILLVEDDPAQMNLMCRAFERSGNGYDLRQATSLAQSQQLIDQKCPDLIIADLVLPDGQALDLLPCQNRLAPYPVLLITAGEDTQIAVEAMKRGAIDYVVKTAKSLAAMPRIAQRVLREWSLIVDQQRAEEERTRFFSLAIDFLMILEFGGKIKRVNPAWQQKLGFASEAIVNQPFLDFIHPDDRAAVQEHLSQTTAVESPRRFVSRCCRKDGACLWFNWSVVPHPAEKLIYGLGHDITEQRQAETRLRTSLDEKELLLKEVYHRVKNNLQLVSSMLSLQAANVGDKSITEILADCQSRVTAMSLVHQRLYQSQDLSQIDLAELTQILANDLYQASGLCRDQVQLELDIQEVPLAIDKAIPCGLILNELLSNAFKYAFPQGRTGRVCVELGRDSQGLVHLAVTDDGVGFPPDFDPDRTKSLGLRLIRSLSRQLDARLHMEQGERTGFSLCLAV